MARNVILATGLVLYPATQLRLGGLPFGPGEAALIVWLIVATAANLLRPRIRGDLALTVLIAFWSTLALALAVGSIVGLSIELYQDVADALHTIFAFGLMFAVSILLALSLYGANERRRVSTLVLVMGTATLLLQLATAFLPIGLPGVEPWYFERFRGWSNDPNQLGFFATFITIMSLYHLQTARSWKDASVAALCGTAGLAVGILTVSDSYIVSMAVAAAAWSTLTGLNWLDSLRTKVTFRGAAVVIALLSMPVAAVSLAPFGRAVFERIEVGSETMYNADHQGDARLTLWREAVALGLESRLLGLGPGPHLTSKSYKRPPPDKFEAHNTPLELLTQGGLLASLAFVGLCITVLCAAWRAREPALVALACGFAAFSMFHFLIRHPIFWFGIVFVLTECGWCLRRNSRPAFSATRTSLYPRGRQTPHP